MLRVKIFFTGGDIKLSDTNRKSKWIKQTIIAIKR